MAPPGGIPRRILYQGPPGSPTGTLYEEVGEVALVQNLPTTADPSQQGGGSQPGSSGRILERTRFSQAIRKSTGSVRTGRGQSPVPRTSDRSRTPDRARTPLRRQTPDREATPDRGKSHAHPATPTFPADCQMQDHSLLRPPGRPLPGILGLLRVDNTLNTQPEVIQHQVRASGGVSGTPGSRTPRAE